MVPAQQNFRHPHPFKLLGPGVLRIAQEPFVVRIRLRTFPVVQGPGDKPRDGIHQDHRRHLAAGYDIVAHRQLPVDVTVTDPLIDPLVSPA